jgi:SAM-dependent methyltransferase
MNYTIDDFAALFGVARNEIPAACTDIVSAIDFGYDLPDREARDRIILQVLQHIDSDKATRVGEHRADIWESCWSDSLKRFVSAGHDADKLVPDFISPGNPIRLNRDYVIPRSPRYEVGFLRVCRAFLFDRYFARAKSVYEFGCGSGYNLVALSQQLPGRKLYGLDWSKSANRTVSLLRESLGIDITGRQFDFFQPDASLDLDPASGALTMCALEQVGPRFNCFLEYLLDKRPQVCVNMEPLLELYDETNLVDHLAARYHRKRGYLEGFLTALRALADKGRIEILNVRRFFFGSLYHEGYSYVAWRPL